MTARLPKLTAKYLGRDPLSRPPVPAHIYRHKVTSLDLRYPQAPDLSKAALRGTAKRAGYRLQCSEPAVKFSFHLQVSLLWTGLAV